MCALLLLIELVGWRLIGGGGSRGGRGEGWWGGERLKKGRKEFRGWRMMGGEGVKGTDLVKFSLTSDSFTFFFFFFFFRKEFQLYVYNFYRMSETISHYFQRDYYFFSEKPINDFFKTFRIYQKLHHDLWCVYIL